MRIGIAELIVIAIIILIFVKPDKIKDYYKAFYKAKNAVHDAKKEVQDELGEVREIKDEITDDLGIKEVNETINDIKMM